MGKSENKKRTDAAVGWCWFVAGVARAMESAGAVDADAEVATASLLIAAFVQVSAVASVAGEAGPTAAGEGAVVVVAVGVGMTDGGER